MARSTTEIQNEIIGNVKADETLAGLTSTSKTAIWRLWSYVVAYCINQLEVIYDALRTEIYELLAKLKPHSLRWYAEKVKAFQFGFNLLAESDQFDNTGYTDDQIEASKIVSYVAVVEQENPYGRTYLRVKVAGSNDEDLQPLTSVQLDALRSYLQRIKDAGVKIVVDSLPPDKLKQKWVIYYDPLILSNTGSRLDGSEPDPVRTAIKEYLKNLPFNGTEVLAHHTDFVQKVEGVKIPHLVECYATYGELPFTAVNVMYLPDSGYLRFNGETDLVIEYVPYNGN